MKASKLIAAVVSGAAALALVGGIAYAIEPDRDPATLPMPEAAQDTSIVKQVASIIVYEDQEEAVAMASEFDDIHDELAMDAVSSRASLSAKHSASHDATAKTAASAAGETPEGSDDSIDVEAAKQRGIQVIYTPTANADSVAELTVALFLLLQRRLYEANEGCRAGRFTSIAPRDFLGTEILGKTFGQIGMGNIAQRIAHIMNKGFGVKVLGYDPFINAEEAARRGFEKVDSMEELLERSDMVNINVPLVPSTEHMISREMFDHFKPGAVFVNAARGAVIDEDALYDALVSGKLKAAACDTFVNEPPTGENKLLSLPNFSATPHIGGNTYEALEKAGMEVVTETLRVLNGEKPIHPVHL